MAEIGKNTVFFMLGAASGAAAHALWQRYVRDSGKDSTQLLVKGVGAALAAGKEMTRKATRFMEEVEDMVAEAQAEVAPPPSSPPHEPAVSEAERV
jgi:hypothetical protein